MKTSRLSLLVSTLALLGAGCMCNTPPGGNDSGQLGDGGPTGGGNTMTELDGGQCLANNAACMPGGLACCNGLCDQGVCRPLCKGANESCQTGADCCNGVQCTNGTCSGPRCGDLGATCSTGAQCCTGVCGGNGQCAAIPGQGGSCKVLGSSCGAGSECCSSLCRFGACAAAAACHAYNDVCTSNADCCSLSCTATSGATGFCQQTSGGGPGCTQSGNPCVDGTGCCTRVCNDLGAGAKVCQPVGGCRVAGDACDGTSACCGAATGGTGTVVCSVPQVKCDNGQACRAPGTICGKPVLPDGGPARRPDGSEFTVNNETNCCEGHKVMGVEYTCRLDRSGVPRCHGGGSNACPLGNTGVAPCCIASGNACDFKDECCDGALCLPGDGGVRKCTTATCSGLGTICTATSECCGGFVCLGGELGVMSCQRVPTGTGSDGGSGLLPDGGSAGSADAGLCKANATACTGGAQCCSGICSGGVCGAPAACQGAAGVCTGSQDCCVGLSCSIPSGMTSGTCATGGTCSGLGQACSGSAPCCAGTDCIDGAGYACSGNSACTCQQSLQ